MFNDLDTTLQAVLDDPAAPVLLRNADVSFETPDKNYRPSQATVNLFLYEVKENRDLRDPEPIFALVNGQYQRTLPPLRVDCAYLVTTWSNQTGALKAAEEHQLLGQALAWLSRLGTIPENFLRGSLVGQPYPAPALVAQMEGKQSLGEFWSALGTPPRPAFTLVVTIALDLEVEQPVGPEVITHAVRLGERNGNQESLYLIAGTVRTAGSGVVIPAAQVTLLEVELTTATDSAGHFRLSGLATGQYTLRVSAVDFQSATMPITVPGTAPGAYDLTLTPSPPVNTPSPAPRRQRRPPKPKPGSTPK
jgi:Pvc16 N-terminal domain/Carboxypeptidase regulatory-like domain